MNPDASPFDPDSDSDVGAVQVAGPAPIDFAARLSVLRRAVDAPDYAARRDREMARQRQADAVELAALADARGVPQHEPLREVALADAPPETRALLAFRRTLERHRESPRESLLRVVSGPFGCGKSAAMAWVALHQPEPFAWISAATILATLRNGWSTNEERWALWESVRVLCVDDLGTETIRSADDTAPIVALFEHRMTSGGLTLATANLNQADFETRYPSGRLRSRLAGQDHGGAATGHRWHVTAKGPDLRLPLNRAALVRGARP